MTARGDDLQFYRKITKAQKLLAPQEEEDLVAAWQQFRNDTARDKILLSHLPLLMKLANSYKGYGFPPDELISEGQLGLIEALKGFDVERGYRFSTYALWWVKAYMKDYILKNWSCVRIATTAAQKKLFFKLRGSKSEFKSLGYEHLSDEEIDQIAADLGVSRQDVVQMDNRLSASDSSLNAFIGGYEDTQWQDVVVDESLTHFEEFEVNQEEAYRRKLLEIALLELKPLEYDVILGRRLMDPPLTLEELALEKKLSRERIRQIEVIAMEKITLKVAALSGKKSFTH